VGPRWKNEEALLLTLALDALALIEISFRIMRGGEYRAWRFRLAGHSHHVRAASEGTVLPLGLRIMLPYLEAVLGAGREIPGWLDHQVSSRLAKGRKPDSPHAGQ